MEVDYFTEEFCIHCQNRIGMIIDWNNGDEYPVCTINGCKQQQIKQVE